ncbi:cytochrome b5 reductase 4-like [Gigantopelta aegis]|uniref:cytochrome b5 reductase 4-like n=1 Tax=Gigantopelta aegis TaxID=1735272 RepID=UPI001B88858C|nr:cytochrome b5 reductase 4-like [Gigantopelta aegis]
MAGLNLSAPQFPASNSAQRISATLTPERKKVALKPGHSLMDWIRLGRSGQDLTSVGGKVLEVSLEDLAKHNKQDDAWIAIRGKVYNITPYLEFHSGGIDELMRGAGIDGTQLFDEIHKWVNAETMLEKCYVGTLKSAIASRKGSLSSRGSNKSNTAATNLLKLTPPPQVVEKPKYEWYQNTKCVIIVVYTMTRGMQSEMVTIDREGRDLRVTILIEDYTFLMHIELSQLVTSDYNVRVDKEFGKVEIVLPKDVPDIQWGSLGSDLDHHNCFVKTAERDKIFRPCKVLSVESVSHDTKLFCVALPEGTRMCVPLGYHVRISHRVSGMDIDRCYTVVLPSLRAGCQDDRVSDGSVLYLMIKVYQDGALSSWIGTLSPGDVMEVSDIEGSFRRVSLDTCTHLVLFAAGTGFTPMVRLIYESLVADTSCKRQVKLLFFNKKHGDIFWKDQLDELAAANNRFSVTYILSEPDEDWDGPMGRVNKDLVKDHIPTVNDGIRRLLCACGPILFTKEVIRLAKELGCEKDHIHAFEG